MALWLQVARVENSRSMGGGRRRIPVGSVGEHVAEASLAMVHVLDGLRRLGHRTGLNPGLDVVLDCDLEHLFNVARGANDRPGQRATEQAPRHHGRDTFVTEADHDLQRSDWWA